MNANTTALPSPIAFALAELIGADTVTFNAGRGDSREEFPKALGSFTIAQARKAFAYGCQQVFNDYRSPLLAKVKAGEQSLPEGVEAGDTEGLFDYWWANIFGQERARTGSGPTGTPIEKQAIQEYLASRPAAFGKLYSERWTDPKELTPKGKPKAKARPASLATLQECLTTLAGGTLSPEKWTAVRADIDSRKAAIAEARKNAEAQAQNEESAPEDLF